MSSFGPFSQQARELEKENQQMKTRIEYLQNELNQKNQLLQQMNQKYTSFSETSPKKVSEMKMHTSSTANRTVYNQLYDQSKYISLLESKIASNNKCSKCYCGCCCCCCGCKCCSKSKNSTKSLKCQESEYRDVCQELLNENRKWEDFCYRIYGVCCSALKNCPDYPEDDTEAQRRVAMNLVRKITKIGCKEISEHSEFEMLKKRYAKTQALATQLHEECDHIGGLLKGGSGRCPRCKCPKIGEVTTIDDYVKGRTDRSSFTKKSRITDNENVEMYSSKRYEEYPIRETPASIRNRLSKVENQIDNAQREIQEASYEKQFRKNVHALHDVTKKLKSDYHEIAALEHMSSCSLGKLEPQDSL